jgi:hypothetical protein
MVRYFEITVNHSNFMNFV